MVCHSWAAMILSLRGYPDQALQRSHEALSFVGDVAHPFSLASALLYAAMFHQYRCEEHATQGWAEALMALSIEQEFPLRAAHGSILRGWARAEQGEGARMLAETREGRATSQAAGAELARPYYLALLAEAQGRVGRAEEGLRVLAEALAAVERTGERHYEAELHRHRGELLLTRSF